MAAYRTIGGKEGREGSPLEWETLDVRRGAERSRSSVREEKQKKMTSLVRSITYLDTGIYNGE
jgi:hypothetical protein